MMTYVQAKGHRHIHNIVLRQHKLHTYTSLKTSTSCTLHYAETVPVNTIALIQNSNNI